MILNMMDRANIFFLKYNTLCIRLKELYLHVEVHVLNFVLQIKLKELKT